MGVVTNFLFSCGIDPVKLGLSWKKANKPVKFSLCYVGCYSIFKEGSYVRTFRTESVKLGLC